MAVDPEDDDIARYVIWRFAYDVERRERRNQLVAAFDNPAESHALLQSLADDLARRRAAGEDVDPREHFSGTDLQPGDARRNRNGRILKRAMRRGVKLSDETLDRLVADLPRGMGVLRFRSDTSD